MKDEQYQRITRMSELFLDWISNIVRDAESQGIYIENEEIQAALEVTIDYFNPIEEDTLNEWIEDGQS